MRTALLLILTMISFSSHAIKDVSGYPADDPEGWGYFEAWQEVENPAATSRIRELLATPEKISAFDSCNQKMKKQLSCLTYIVGQDMTTPPILRAKRRLAAEVTLSDLENSPEETYRTLSAAVDIMATEDPAATQALVDELKTISVKPDREGRLISMALIERYKFACVIASMRDNPSQNFFGKHISVGEPGFNSCFTLVSGQMASFGMSFILKARPGSERLPQFVMSARKEYKAFSIKSGIPVAK